MGRCEEGRGTGSGKRERKKFNDTTRACNKTKSCSDVLPHNLLPMQSTLCPLIAITKLQAIWGRTK